LAKVRSNSTSASAGRFISISISPTSSRAGASGPGVTAFFSVASSMSAAARNAVSASSRRPSANASHADAARRWISTCPAQYASRAPSS
jgi:hypothetical protein